MVESGLFGKLNLDLTFNIGIYISGIILTSSFLVVPTGVIVASLRNACFVILILSVILKELDYALTFYSDKKQELALFLYVLYRVFYFIIVIITVVNIQTV